MTARQFLGLTLISAIWGGSFIFMRVLSPVFGPVFTASIRLLSASFFLYLYVVIRKKDVEWRKHWKWFLIIGVLNSAIPFTLYGVAALYIPASLSVILNSTSPMFGMLFGVLLIHERLTLRKVVGLFLGSIGVTIVTQIQVDVADVFFYVSIVACITAALLYGLSGALLRKYAFHISSVQMTLGSMLCGGLVLLPFGFLSPIQGIVLPIHILYFIIFGVIGTAIAYLIYFQLLREVGPVKALMTTYLMPVFGILWGVTILNEELYLTTIIGLVVIISGIILITSKTKMA